MDVRLELILQWRSDILHRLRYSGGAMYNSVIKKYMLVGKNMDESLMLIENPRTNNTSSWIDFIARKVS